MTQKAKFGWLLSAAAIASAVLTLSALATPTIRAIDLRYVKQAGYIQTRQLDSLTHEQELRAINEKLARVDSGVLCLRHPKRDECR